MRSSFALLAGLLASARALPALVEPRQSGNPFSGHTLLVNPSYSESLEETRQALLAEGDETSAAKVQFVQNKVGTFVWISNIASLAHIDDAIANARAAQENGENPIIGLVLYNIPDRDCSAGHSSGELSFAENGLERYQTEYVQPFAQKLKEASDLQFAVVLEPDAMGNMVTGESEFCQNAREPQQEGIAYAIQQLQADNVHLYLDVANGGWLGWPDNLELTADVVETILQKAGSNTRIRGYASNVSNYNPYQTDDPPPYTEDSPSPDESRYADNLAAAFGERGLPTSFIIDQGRVGGEGAREEWGEWCNIFPAGFGQPFTTDTNNPNVDAVVWIKPGGESDGECGMEGAPIAGAWFDEYAQMLAKNAHPDILAEGGDGGGGDPNPGGNCSGMYGQCGGQGWSGPTCCEQGACKVTNEWYSQCL